MRKLENNAKEGCCSSVLFWITSQKAHVEGRNTKNNRFVLATLSHRDSVLKESPCIEQDYVEPNLKKQRVCVRVS